MLIISEIRKTRQNERKRKNSSLMSTVELLVFTCSDMLSVDYNY